VSTGTAKKGFWLWRVLLAALIALAVAPAALAKNDALSLVPNDAISVGVVKLADMRSSPLSSALFQQTANVSMDGDAQAYAIFRTHMSWEAGSATSRLVVREALGATPQATAAIWRFLLDVDWIATVELSLAPPDHPLLLLLANPRRAGYRSGDGLWIRIVDLPAALSGRSYGEGGPLVLEVRDAICDWNDGRWQLDGGACERTDAEPDLALDVSALGSAYLGAVSFTQLRDAGRVQELREGAIRRADALFAWRPLPWCQEIF